jgi:hypothetical protein
MGRDWMLLVIGVFVQISARIPYYESNIGKNKHKKQHILAN